MDRILRTPLTWARTGVVLVLLLPVLAPLVGVDSRQLLGDAHAHLLLLSGMASVALAAALYASHAAWARHDVRSALVASGFTTISGLLLVHGLATPGGPFFEGFVSTVEIAGVLAIPVGSAFIGAAMTLSPRWTGGRRRVVAIQVTTIAALITFAAIGLGAPGMLPTRPLMVAPTSYVVLAPTIALFGWAAWRAHLVATMTRRPGDASMFAGIVILGVAVVEYVTSTPFAVQFWFGHVLELVGFAAISAAVVADLRRPVSAWRLTERRDGRAVLTSSEELLGGYVHALTVTLSQIDPSTWHHSRRVAELAVEVGEELGLDFATVRRLAVAGLVHDVGKLRIPHDVLHKAGELDDAEFEMIRAHPSYGAELLAQLRGFDAELAIVLGHHEKLSGRGYPQGLHGDAIGLETRIMTACDVYDALTDSRSYKEPWPVAKAVGLLREECGESFDPAVVEALARVIGRRSLAHAVPDDPTADVVQLRADVPTTAPIELPLGPSCRAPRGLTTPRIRPPLRPDPCPQPDAAGRCEPHRARELAHCASWRGRRRSDTP